ncbi:MAG: hypothetical protein ACK4IY_05200 [Chitinophagales bacterium]
MKKRILKKRINRNISGALDLLYLSASQSDIDAKSELLLNLYEQSIREINNAKLLPDTKSRKAHFKKLKDHFNQSIGKVFEGL